MIRYLRLKNFKSYKESKVVFHPRITLIKGEGLSGKSNLRRAIELLNRYRYSKNNKAKFAVKEELELELKTSEDKIELWTKDKDVLFKLNEDKFKRKKTPEEIIESIGLNEVNIQKQLDFPLIVNNSSSKLSKLINSILGIEKIDGFIKSINQSLKTKRILIESKEKELIKLRKQKEKYNKLKLIRLKLRKIKKLRNEITIKEERHILLKDILEEIEDSNNRINSLRSKIKTSVNIKAVEDIRVEKTKIKQRVEEIERTILEIDQSNDSLSHKVKRYRILIDKYTKKIKEERECPYCLSALKEKQIIELKKRLKNEIDIN